MRTMAMVFVGLLVAGCGGSGLLGQRPEAPAASETSSEGQTRPRARPGTLDTTAPKPAEGARTVEEFDTTSAEQRAAAAAAPSRATEQDLGETVASLGDVSRPGFWLETPLVSAPARGRVLFPDTGKSSQVDLLPIDGPATAGSRISLAAMRVLEAPLTGLPTLKVFLVPQDE